MQIIEQVNYDEYGLFGPKPIFINEGGFVYVLLPFLRD